MSEKLHPNSYLIPAEFMEPQRPVTPEGYTVTRRDNIQSEELRSIPDALHPVYMRSSTDEKVVKGGDGSDFNKLQDAAYQERERNRNMWIERSLGGLAVGATADESNEYDRLLSDEDIEGSVEAAAVRETELTEAEKQDRLVYSERIYTNLVTRDLNYEPVYRQAFREAGLEMPVRAADIVKAIGENPTIRESLQAYYSDKIARMTDLPDRVLRNVQKSPGYPGSKSIPGQEYAVYIAMMKISGGWDYKNEDPLTDVDASGNAILGQHRFAADQLLSQTIR